MLEKIKHMRNEEGFSLIELVVAVGILAILSVVGVVAYSSITENARKTAVDSAASEVLTGATAYDSSGDDYTNAAVEWNNSAKKDEGVAEIEVRVEKNAGNICAIAINTDGYEAQRGAGCEGSTGTPGGEEEETTPPVVENPITITHDFYSPDMIFFGTEQAGKSYTIKRIDAESGFVIFETSGVFPEPTGARWSQNDAYLDGTTGRFETILSKGSDKIGDSIVFEVIVDGVVYSYTHENPEIYNNAGSDGEYTTIYRDYHDSMDLSLITGNFCDDDNTTNADDDAFKFCMIGE